MKKILPLFIVLLATSAIHAQVTFDYGKAADDYFKKGIYTSASEYYEKYLTGLKKKPKQDRVTPPVTVTSVKYTGNSKLIVSTKEEATYNLAESYRHQNLHVKAEPFYVEATTYNKPPFPLARYWYGKSLRALGKYGAADSALKQFLQEYTTSDSISLDANKELATLAFIQSELVKKDLSLYTVVKSGNGLNSEGGSSAPAFIDSSIVYFTSTRISAGSKDKTHINRIYKASFSDTGAAGVEKVAIDEVPKLHQGSVTFSPKGDMMILSRATINGRNKSEALYYSIKTSNGWSTPTILDSFINMPGSNNGQPFLMADGKTLLFSSNRKGGLGGYDLWYVTLDTSKPNVPVNLGEVVNTPADDETPYYHALSKSLVFSTNGRVGMGGFDLFVAKGTIGNFKTPKNLGYPLNSIKDDQYFASLGTEKNMLASVMFSSDRSSACCLDLFELHKVRPLKTITGTVVSCTDNQPLGGVTITILDTVHNKTITVRTTSNDGSYSFNLEDFMPLKATAKLNGYNGGSLSFTGPEDDEEEKYTVPSFCLTKPTPPPLIDTIITLTEVYYAFDKSQLTAESYPSLDNVVAMMNQYATMVIQINGHTDSKGTDAYNQKLSEERAQSCVNYLISKGISKDRLVAKGYGKSMPVVPNTKADGSDDEEGRKKNRRTEFKVLSYK